MKPVRLQWVGGEHDFALPIGQLRALQDGCDAGPQEVFERLRGTRWLVNDVVEVLRLGLIGADAMPASEAGQYVTTLFDQHPKMALRITAYQVIAHALVGDKDDPVGEDSGGTENPPEKSDSPSSTETAQ